MSPTQLPENATVEEIEHEITFVLILLDTLDSESSDFEAKKAEYEAALHDLEARLEASRSKPQTPSPEPHDQVAFGTGQSYDLPSRPADTGRRSVQNQSPLVDRANRSREHGPDGMLEEDDSPISSPSSTLQGNAKKKRRRPDSGLLNISQSKLATKHRKTSPGLSGASTPTSDDFVPETNYMRPAGNRMSILERIKQQQEQLENRFKMEREDEAMARSLDASTATAPSAPFQFSTQSWLDRNGRIIPQPRAEPEPAPDWRLLKHERSSTPTIAERGTVQPAFSSLDASDSSGEELSEITPEQFRFGIERSAQRNNGSYGHTASPRREITTGSNTSHQLPSSSYAPAQYYGSDPNYGSSSSYMPLPTYAPAPSYGSVPNFGSLPVSAPLPQGFSNGPHAMNIPGAWPTSSMPHYTAGIRTGYTSASAMNPVSNLTSNLTSNIMNLQRAVQQRFIASTGFAPNATATNFGLNAPGQGPSALGYVPSTGFPSRPQTEVRERWDLAGDLEARGFESLLHDPTKTKEDLQQLLENIRPDEEVPPEMRIGTPAGLKISLMEHQKLGLAWLKSQEEGSNKGGILADEMGLGKTIQALALILSRPSEDRAQKTTIIIAPVSLMRQWETEIETRVKPSHKLRVFVYHGQRAKNVSYKTLACHDVVLTTFGKVASEWTRKCKSVSASRQALDAHTYPLLCDTSRWYRVIVDEAQFIKNKNTKAAQAACQLAAKYRLCMTGTPMNGVTELYSLIHFLRIAPYNVQEEFNRDFKRPIEGRSPYSRDRAMKALQVLLKAILLRRSKKSKIDGNPILNLPPRTVEIKHVIFSEDEQSFYDALEKQVQLQVNKYLQAGRIGTNYSFMLVRLLRLRQACCHPHLIKDYATEADTEVSINDMEQTVKQLGEPAVARIKEANGAFECPVCFDGIENPIIFFPCGHDTCTECFARLSDPSLAIAEGIDSTSEFKCPECRGTVEKQKVFNFSTFKKVHMPEQYEGELGNILGEDEDDSDESDDDESDEDDANDQGDLRDFIVADDEVEEDDEEGDDEDVNGADGADDAEAEAEDDEEAPRRPRRSLKNRTRSTYKAKPKAKATKSTKDKGKAKDKGKKKEKTKKTMAQLKAESKRSAAAKRRYLRRLKRDWITSSKIDRTLEILKEVEDNDPTEKTIIFSQFTSLLDLLEIPISERGKRYTRFDGSMSSKERHAAVHEFQYNPQVKLMLVSLKAGNAGLNLTAASQVIILDPFWNPMIEEQAIDRAHRIGQRRPIYVHRILVAGTVEDRIIELQEKKRALINEALDESAGASLSRLGVRELSYLFGLNSSLN